MLNAKIITPKNEHELLDVIKVNKGDFRFGAGFTDLILELKKTPEEKVTVINLAALNEPGFSTIAFENGKLRIGSLVTAMELSKNEKIRKLFPVLHMSADMLASKQIRQVATVGGNLCTASPAGDISTALVALQADCELLNSAGQIRMIPIGDFFMGVRKTVLREDEILKSVSIPVRESSNNVKSGFIKIGTRNAMECSVVSLAYHFYIGDNGIVEKAGIAIGSSAPVIKFTRSAVEFITDRKINEMGEEEAVKFAEKVIEYSDPITDVRGSAWYRKQVLYNISKGIFNNN